MGSRMEHCRARTTQGRQFNSSTYEFDSGPCEFDNGAHKFDSRTPKFEQGVQPGVRLHRRVRGRTAVNILSPTDTRCDLWARLESNCAGAA